MTRKKIVLMLSIIFISCLGLNNVAEAGLFRRARTIKLPKPDHKGKISVEEAIYGRRSIREFSSSPLTLHEVGQLLWSAAGNTVDGITGPTRAYPSAGGIYPLEVYLVAGEVMGLKAGVYKYDGKKNTLRLKIKGDFRKKLSKAAMGQKMIKKAPATVVVTAAFKKATSKYGDRAKNRYIPMDTGHLGQNIHLQAYSLGLGTVMVGAFNDKNVARIIKPGKEQPLYLMPIGKPLKDGIYWDK